MPGVSEKFAGKSSTYALGLGRLVVPDTLLPFLRDFLVEPAASDPLVPSVAALESRQQDAGKFSTRLCECTQHRFRDFQLLKQSWW